MNGVADVLDCGAFSQDDAVVKVGRATRLLGVHADEVKVLPQLVLKVLQIELHLAAEKTRFQGCKQTFVFIISSPDDHAVRLPSQPIYLLEGDLVDLVVNVEAGHVHAVALDDVDKLVGAAVLAKEYLRVEDLVFVQDHLHQLLVHPGEGHGRVKADAAGLLLLEVNVRGPLVQPDSYALQFFFQEVAEEKIGYLRVDTLSSFLDSWRRSFLPVDVLLRSVQDHEHHV